MKALNDDLQMRDDWLIPLATGSERVRANGKRAHSTQKPEALLYRVILGSSNPGDIILDPFSGSGTTCTVAKKLGRQWIGIERDPTYVKVARERVAAAQSFPAEALSARGDRKPVRIPFGTLIEQGFLHAGQQLYFGADGKAEATILANGHLRCGGHEGSIHMLGRLITGAPCNGWEHWYATDPHTGERVVIDTYRAIIRNQLATPPSEST
jgi:modification methylase